MNPKARDVITFFLGFALLIHQTVVAPTAQPILVGAGIAMMFGAPFVTAFLDKWTK